MTEPASLSSFRDPSGAVFIRHGRVLRKVSASATPETLEFLQSPLARQFIAEEKLVRTEQVPPNELDSHLNGSNRTRLEMFGEGGMLLEHEFIWFQSYVYEWPPEMLYAAGMLTLDIAEQSLVHGFGLKDATPYNILFRGAKPIFVDMLSFEKRTPTDFIWLPYAQFVRMFLLPLLVQKDFGSGLDQLFTTRTHGLEPDEVYEQYGWGKRLRLPLLTEVSLPTWLKKRSRTPSQGLYKQRLTSDPEKARFILRSQLRRLRRSMKKAAPLNARKSNWASYMNTFSYSDNEFKHKHDFVERVAAEIKPKTALDIGCNTGHFSAIAAQHGARVVALDIDPVVVGTTWRRASEQNLDVLPLVLNLARPTPATGWRNAEYPAFLTRAMGKFELILMLATLHHLIVTERIPLDEVAQLAADLTTGYAVVEYVAKEDPMFRQIARGREHLHGDFTRERFESSFGRHFTILRSEPVKADLRWLYLLEKR